MKTVGIVAGGPLWLIPKLTNYQNHVDYWIGADRGAWTLLENNIKPDIAVGDFDSLSVIEREKVRQSARHFQSYPIEKDQTDLEIALMMAYNEHPEQILLFGVTGGRLDHSLINIQTLYQIMDHGIHGKIIDQNNQLEMVAPGHYTVTTDCEHQHVSFIPYTHYVRGLTLNHFYYPLIDQTISWGSTLCISNKLLTKSGTFSFSSGILLVIKSRDAINDTIPK